MTWFGTSHYFVCLTYSNTINERYKNKIKEAINLQIKDHFLGDKRFLLLRIYDTVDLCDVKPYSTDQSSQHNEEWLTHW